MKTKLLLLSLFGCALLVPVTSGAEVTLTLTFDNVPPAVVCNEVWQEHMLSMWFTETTAEDFVGIGRCEFDVTMFPVCLCCADCSHTVVRGRAQRLARS